VIDQAICELAPVVGTKEACRVLGEARARHYRRHRRSPLPPRQTRSPRPQPRALSADERAALRDVLNSEAHVDEAPATVYAKLLDDGRYLGSVSTMYRVLRAHDEVRERRRQATHPAKKKPELLATGPNEVWSWDITKLLGPAKWSYFYLYVVLDIYSRYVPGWMLARAENATLAKALLAETVDKHGIEPDRLTLHSDRGSPMTAKPFVFLMADLGVTRSYSRPHTSNDNPYSESHFRTAKYRPDFPDRFGSYEDAHAWCTRFFSWYCHEHRHSGIGYHTPADVHFGRAQALRDQRTVVLDRAYAAHPERFVRKAPEPPKLPTAAWINEPKEVNATAQ
jgi:putative transposase